IKLKNNQNGFKVSQNDENIAIGFKQGSPLKEQINKIIADIPQDVREQLMNECIDIFCGKTVEKFSLDIPDVLQDAQKLRVAIEGSYEPFNQISDKETFGCVKVVTADQSPLYANGYDVQIARYIAAKLNRTLEIYKVDWDNLSQTVNTDVVDAVISGMSPNAQGTETLEFSDSYYRSDIVIVINK
ncbi:MAG: transporter substrate-binding domain-containing protein, partial [Oscillospiraceae bacterium]|nr:transporter substrate-binding domain-containing protein [Candidatus Equicaccousia limihippi]